MCNTFGSHLEVGFIADEANSGTTSPLLGDLVNSPVMGDPLETAEEGTTEEGSIFENTGEEAEEKDDSETVDDSEGSEGQIFSYERLKAKSRNPVKGIDYKRREVCG